MTFLSLNSSVLSVKISEENFIYDNRDLNFNISLSTGKAVSSEMVVQALIQLLKVHGL